MNARPPRGAPPPPPPPPREPARRWFDLSRAEGLGPALDEATLRARSNPCLVETDRGRVVTRLDYRGFRRAAAAVAHGLVERGVGPDVRVAIALPNGPRWLLTAFAALHLGATLVPLDVRADPGDLARLLGRATPRILVVDGPLWRRLGGEALPALDVVVDRPLGDLRGATPWEAFADGADTATERPLPPPVPRPRDATAAIVFSSGTGGAPKGCRLTHGNYLAQMEALANRFQFEEDDVYLSILPTHHALDFMCGFLAAFLCGTSVVHLRTLRPEFVIGALREQRVTLLGAVPALLEALLRRVRERLTAQPRLARKGLRGMERLNAWLTRRRPNPLVSRTLLAPIHQALGGRLRCVFAGGAFVPPELAQGLYDLGIPVAIGYGLTEACAVVSVNALDPFRPDTVGAPLPGTEVRLADLDEAGRGELEVRGPGVFAGYLDDPAATAAVLVDGWLRTGDLAAIDATGHLRIVGRRKDVIVTAGGKNVSPEEVEAKLRGLPVAELAVLAAHRVWPDASGREEALVVALRLGDDADRGAALDALRATNRRLPAHHRARSAVVVPAPFPRTPSLKVRRGELEAAVRALGGPREAIALG